MMTVSTEQIQRFRLHTHHLDAWQTKEDASTVVGACGMQNSPPGAWEAALHNRIAGCTSEQMRQMLEEDKTLLQAWSFRGAPVVFPTAQSDVFLHALIAEKKEPWIYTRGIQLALDFLGMALEYALDLLRQVMSKLDDEVITRKETLDQTLAAWILPLLPADKRVLWTAPSMYGSPDRQTVGGAVVSFLLRPCSFMGLVVFATRSGIRPSFTSYVNWVGHALDAKPHPARKLVRKFLHCYGPATVRTFANWLGCSPAQAKRMWESAAEEMETVRTKGGEANILATDKALLHAPPIPTRTLHLLKGHDPYLGLFDRDVILDDPSLQRRMWQTVSNPGALVHRGEIVGMWKDKKKGKTLRIELCLWRDANILQKDIQALCEEYAAFQHCTLTGIDV